MNTPTVSSCGYDCSAEIRHPHRSDFPARSPWSIFCVPRAYLVDSREYCDLLVRLDRSHRFLLTERPARRITRELVRKDSMTSFRLTMSFSLIPLPTSNDLGSSLVALLCLVGVIPTEYGNGTYQRSYVLCSSSMGRTAVVRDVPGLKSHQGSMWITSCRLRSSGSWFDICRDCT
jgi:hypothetical protein